MNGFLRHINLVFLGLLGLAIVVIAAYQLLWIEPGKRCEAAGDWWDPARRICGHVLYLPDVTHRPAGSKVLVYPGLPRSRAAAAMAGSGPATPVAKTPPR